MSVVNDVTAQDVFHIRTKFKCFPLNWSIIVVHSTVTPVGLFWRIRSLWFWYLLLCSLNGQRSWSQTSCPVCVCVFWTLMSSSVSTDLIPSPVNKDQLQHQFSESIFIFDWHVPYFSSVSLSVWWLDLRVPESQRVSCLAETSETSVHLNGAESWAGIKTMERLHSTTLEACSKHVRSMFEACSKHVPAQKSDAGLRHRVTQWFCSWLICFSISLMFVSSC